MTFAIFSDARMTSFSHEEQCRLFGAQRTERWRAVVAVEGWELQGLNVSGVSCLNCGKRKHRGRAWAKDSGCTQAGIRGLQKDSGLHQEIQRLCNIRD